MNTYKVTYTKATGSNGTILVRANDEKQAVVNAKDVCYMGREFRNPVLFTGQYIKPRKQGFFGHN